MFHELLGVKWHLTLFCPGNSAGSAAPAVAVPFTVPQITLLAPNRKAWQARLMDIGQLIVKTPGTCGGRARIAGKRIPVSSIYRWFLRGHEPEDILEKFDGIALAEIYAAISYALSNLEEITSEIEREDRLGAKASQTAAIPAA